MPEVERREKVLVAALLAAGVVLRVVVTLLTKDHRLLADQIEYNASASLFADGHPFWGLAPLGYPHASVWKAPLYGAWVGVWYTLAGDHPARVEVVQAFVGGATIFLTWLLARRLFGRGVALTAAAIVTVYPLAWQFGAELFPEALAVPLVTFTLWAFLGRQPTARLAIALGALMGVNLLLRPTSVALFAAILAAFIIAAGARRGIAMTALAIVAAAIVIAPWTIRNAVVVHSFVPVSVQDAAVEGTFNPTSAADRVQPYGWRAITPFTLELLRERPRPGEVELRRRLYHEGFRYIGDHPASVPKAFFWNGITRFWDVRRPGYVLDEAEADGRRRSITAAGLVMYYVLLPLSIFGLFTLRRRREIVIPVLALALASSIVYTIDSGTRYRSPLEPLIVILACAPFAGRLERLAGPLALRRQAQPEHA